MTMPDGAPYVNFTKDISFDSGNAPRHITSALLTHPLSSVYRKKKIHLEEYDVRIKMILPLQISLCITVHVLQAQCFL